MKPMSRKNWQALRDDIVDQFEAALDNMPLLNEAAFSDKRDAAVRARDAVLKSLYEANAIEPPKGIDPT